MAGYEYHRPRSLDEAFHLMETIPGARYVAGGTDLLVSLASRVKKPPALVSLRSIPELEGIEVGEVTRIGALTTISDLVQHAALRERYPVLVEAARRLGSTQIRNVATLGGNLCNASPCADTATALLVLDARVGIDGPRGRREVPLEQFFLGPGVTSLGPGEIASAILLDPPAPGARATFRKRGRIRVDLAMVSVAVLLVMEGDRCRKARVAAGSVAPTPLRLLEVEARLGGMTVTSEILDALPAVASRSVLPITDIRATAEYRRHIVGVLLGRALKELLEPACDPGGRT